MYTTRGQQTEKFVYKTFFDLIKPKKGKSGSTAK